MRNRVYSRECDFLKIFSPTENEFSGKTYFYTIASRRPPTVIPDDGEGELLARWKGCENDEEREGCFKGR